MKRSHVLIVDDDRDLAKCLADFVEMNGHEATVASNGKEAIDHHKRGRFDLTFMDVDMPVMNGVDSFFEIRKVRPAAAVVLMTGLWEPIIDRALQNGALGVLLKPFTVSLVLAALA